MKRTQGIWILSIFLALAVSGQAFGAIFYVDDDAGGPGTGTRIRPFPTIQAGIDRAAHGDTVRVLSGTYRECIVLKDGVKLIGGSGPPTIDGGRDGSVVTAIGVGSRTRFDGFRVINGDASEGGGMYVEDSTLRIRYCTFENNYGWSGAGIYLTGASPRITACRFENNRSVNGGGIDMQFDSNPTVERCDFEGNRADHDIGVSKGAAIAIGVNCRPSIKDCQFQENYSGLYGGGIAVTGSTAVIENCVFNTNRTDYYGYGGAIWAEPWEGTGTQVLIFNSTFFDNRALVGGAVTGWGADISLVNCTLYGNRATGSASAQGGALFNSGGATISAYNSIIWNNSSPQISHHRGSAPLVIRHCDVEGGHGGEGNIDADPGFVNTDSGNFHLRSDSPCIDAGFDYLLMPDTDIDGDERILDGDENGTVVPDMGVDEYYPSRPLLLRGTFTRWE